MRDWTLDELLLMDPPKDPDEVRIIAIKLAQSLQTIATRGVSRPDHFATTVLNTHKARLSHDLDIREATNKEKHTP